MHVSSKASFIHHLGVLRIEAQLKFLKICSVCIIKCDFKETLPSGSSALYKISLSNFDYNTLKYDQIRHYPNMRLLCRKVL